MLRCILSSLDPSLLTLGLPVVRSLRNVMFISFKNSFIPSLRVIGGDVMPLIPGSPLNTIKESQIKSWVTMSCSTTNAAFFIASMDLLITSAFSISFLYRGTLMAHPADIYLLHSSNNRRLLVSAIHRRTVLR